ASCRGTDGRDDGRRRLYCLGSARSSCSSSCPALCRTATPLYTAGPSRCGMPSFMELALDEARKAQDAGEVPIGCVIVRDGAVIAAAHNRTLTDRDPTAHAEIIAIRAAARQLGSERLIDCDLHVTLEPCAMCAAAISLARVRRLYYGAPD